MTDVEQTPLNLHLMVRQFKHENQILNKLKDDLEPSHTLRQVGLKLDEEDFEAITNRDFNNQCEVEMNQQELLLKPTFKLPVRGVSE